MHNIFVNYSLLIGRYLKAGLSVTILNKSSVVFGSPCVDTWINKDDLAESFESSILKKWLVNAADRRGLKHLSRGGSIKPGAGTFFFRVSP